MLNAGIEEMNNCSAYYFGRSYDYFYFGQSDSVIANFENIPLLIEFDLETGFVDPQPTGGGPIGSTTDPFGPNGVQGSQVGLEEEFFTDFHVYPNPTNNILNVELNSGASFEWKIITLSGRVMITGEGSGNTKIDVSALPSSLYLIQIHSDKFSTTKKVIKQ